MPCRHSRPRHKAGRVKLCRQGGQNPLRAAPPAWPPALRRALRGQSRRLGPCPARIRASAQNFLGAGIALAQCAQPPGTTATLHILSTKSGRRTSVLQKNGALRQFRGSFARSDGPNWEFRPRDSEFAGQAAIAGANMHSPAGGGRLEFAPPPCVTVPRRPRHACRPASTALLRSATLTRAKSPSGPAGQCFRAASQHASASARRPSLARAPALTR